MPDGSINPWVIAITVTLATFMEVLDGSIANVALPHIAGNLSASADESTWVLTSYLVSNAIISTAVRMAIVADWPEAFLHELRGDLHGQFVLVRVRAQFGDAGVLPHFAGHRRRAGCNQASRPS